MRGVARTVSDRDNRTVTVDREDSSLSGVAFVGFQNMLCAISPTFGDVGSVVS